MTTKGSDKKYPSHTVYWIATDGPKRTWQPIGVMWKNAEGKGFNVVLSKTPPTLELTALPYLSRRKEEN
ncbi:hypothetical protein SAMN02745157_4545 [Kaistia soli DSM 19436]|uniref:Uncharacterized protein n=1 Tax=Kaistia soli DSM 19436 TaxID=1122133 RepID=A0A1M5LCR2_9HYPH|nr:hypothetical protein SAMN02745157_4545 [Kaistia soli DSM 19436]